MADVFYYSQASGDNDGTSEANAFTAIQTALNSLSAGDHLYCKRHSSREGAITTNLSFSTSAGSGGSPTVIEGYGTTPGDGIMYQTKSPIDFTGEHVYIKYLDIDTETDGNAAFKLFGDGNLMYRCVGNNTTTNTSGGTVRLSDASAVECVFRGVSTTSGHAVAQITNSALIGCYIERTNDDNDGEIVELIASFTRNAVIDCLLISGGGNASNGIWMNFTNSFQNFICNNTIVNCGGAGIYHDDGTANGHTSPIIFWNNLLYNCGYGINNNQATLSGTLALFASGNAFGAMGTAQTRNISANENPITLTASPFVDTTNYQLNNVAGGGALVKGVAGLPDPSDITATARKQFRSVGGILPNPNTETSTTF